MKILLRASASPRAARPPRPTSVPIKHCHRNRKNLTSLLLYFGRRLRPDLSGSGWHAPGSPKEIRAPALPRPAYLGKPRATVTALYRDRSQAQARLIFTALPQLRCPYLNHIQVVNVDVAATSSIRPRLEIISHTAETVLETVTATVEAWRGRTLGRPRALGTRATDVPPRQVPKLRPT